MRTNLKRVVSMVGGAAAVSVVASLAPLAANVASATQLPAGSPSEGAVTLSPATGTSSTGFQIIPPTGAACDGAGADNWRYHTYITPLTNDPSQLQYTNGTPGPTPTANLRTAAGAQLRNFSPAIGNNFLAQQTASFASGAFGPSFLPVPGEYWVGFACTTPDGTGGGPTDGFLDVEQYWATAITITASAGAGANNFTYSVGVVPQPPTIDSVAPGDGQATVSFTPGAADPAASSFEVTATPQGGGTPVVVPGSGSPIVVTGLTNGVTYDFEMTATNDVGTSGPSNVVSATPQLGAQPPVQALQAIPGAQSCVVSWQAPTGLTATNYTVVVTQAGTPIAGSPFTVTSPLSLDLLGLTAGLSYDITVTANYPAPDFGTPANTSCIPTSAQFIVQQVSVVRPPGALILTQRCGVYGELPAFVGGNSFPGFVTDVAQGGIDLPLLAATGFPGTAPTLDPAGTTPDPEFAEYPNPGPASYPTYCGLDLGTATLVTQGNIAGYYQATGRLNQVSILDTRDGDPGWTLNGEMSAFDDGFGVGFEGSYLGWDPQLTDVTVTAGYTQVVTEGATVLPGTGIPGDTGLGDGEVLASAAAGQGLGVAILDARIFLLIPPSVPAATYNGELTLSFL